MLDKVSRIRTLEDLEIQARIDNVRIDPPIQVIRLRWHWTFLSSGNRLLDGKRIAVWFDSPALNADLSPSKIILIGRSVSHRG
ncbi:MAG: hypothetical protein R3C17_03050 [Planctomycetaceae bacterium]